MKIIRKYVEQISEEVEGAMDYAERFVEQKAMGRTARASKFREMANDELNHAHNIRDMATEDIAGLNSMGALSVEDDEKWSAALKKCIEKIALIKQILSL
jgi:hypothetical protein